MEQAKLEFRVEFAGGPDDGITGVSTNSRHDAPKLQLALQAETQCRHSDIGATVILNTVAGMRFREDDRQDGQADRTIIDDHHYKITERNERDAVVEVRLQYAGGLNPIAQRLADVLRKNEVSRHTSADVDTKEARWILFNFQDGSRILFDVMGRPLGNEGFTQREVRTREIQDAKTFLKEQDVVL